jgi:hypothetical protein
MRIPGAIVDPPPDLLPIGIADLVHGGGAGAQSIGDGYSRVALEYEMGFPVSGAIPPVERWQFC